MKRLVLFFCIFFAFNLLWAQKNPVAGFIITNEGDTVKGFFDLRSNVINGKECHFQANDSKDYQVYYPGSILKYGTIDGGLLYESLRVPYEGTERTIFAEYLIKGGVSLFYYSPRNGISTYYFVDEEGKITMMTDPKTSSMDSNELEKARHRAMNDATQVFSRDSRFVEQLLESHFERRNLTKLTHEFNDIYCTGAGDCVEFNYNPQKAALTKFRFRAEAGLGYGSIHAKRIEGYTLASADADFSTMMPRFAAGVDLAFPRYSNHLTIQLMASISRYSGHKTLDDLDRSLSGYYWGIHPGLTYQFLPKAKISPLVHAGINMEFPFGVKDENMSGYWVSYRRRNVFSVEMGYYIGAGVNVGIGKHSLQLTLDYSTHSAFNTPVYDFTVNNFLLSVSLCL